MGQNMSSAHCPKLPLFCTGDSQRLTFLLLAGRSMEQQGLYWLAGLRDHLTVVVSPTRCTIIQYLHDIFDDQKL